MGELVTQNQNAVTSIATTGGFELMQRMAKMFSASSLVPAEYRKPGGEGLANCVIAIDIAHRMEISPMLVMQNLHVIQGRPSWGAPFLISCVNSCRKFSALRYEFNGKEGDEFGCRAVATEKATGTVLEGSWVTIAIAKSEGWFGKSGSKWKTMPDQMLRYRAASWWTRVYAPEISMGMLTSDEAEDIAPPPPAKKAAAAAPAQRQRGRVEDAVTSDGAPHNPETGELDDMPEPFDAELYLAGLGSSFDACQNIDALAKVWTDAFADMAFLQVDIDVRKRARALYEAAQVRVNGPAADGADASDVSPIRYIGVAVSALQEARTSQDVDAILKRCENAVRTAQAVTKAASAARDRIAAEDDRFPGDQ